MYINNYSYISSLIEVEIIGKITNALIRWNDANGINLQQTHLKWCQPVLLTLDFQDLNMSGKKKISFLQI